MIRPIYLYDSKILRQPTEEIEFLSVEVERGLSDAYDTLRAIGGVGLAANQIGLHYKFFVINSGNLMAAFLNPRIVSHSKDTYEEEEGCLSLPGILLPVTRYERIKVEYKDHLGKDQTLELDGLLARIFQHELDHLNGIYMYQRVPKLLPSRQKKALKVYLEFLKKKDFDILEKLGATKPHYDIIIEE